MATKRLTRAELAKAVLDAFGCAEVEDEHPAPAVERSEIALNDALQIYLRVESTKEEILWAINHLIRTGELVVIAGESGDYYLEIASHVPSGLADAMRVCENQFEAKH